MTDASEDFSSELNDPAALLEAVQRLAHSDPRAALELSLRTTQAALTPAEIATAQGRTVVRISLDDSRSLRSSTATRTPDATVANMIAISTTAVPDHVRGTLTRWLTEPAPGLHAGTVANRVREELWTESPPASAAATLSAST